VKLGMVAHVYNPSGQEGETEPSKVWNQPGLNSETVSKIKETSTSIHRMWNFRLAPGIKLISEKTSEIWIKSVFNGNELILIS
jgi:hypothetical protein